MSTHAVEIVQIDGIQPHPHPDVNRMEITHIWGWQCCIGINQFKAGDKAVYIPPDFMVKLSRPEFFFLKNKNNEGKEYERIRVRRFKGALSQGLLISVPEFIKNLPVGTNVIDQLEIYRYEPPLPKSTGGSFVPGPSGLYTPKFDVESYQRYRHLFTAGEQVVITEKLHGASGRYLYAQTKDKIWQQFCGSRTNFMGDDEKNIWWMAFRQNPDIGRWCQEHPEMILYCECYGKVQGLQYGAKINDIFVGIFGILNKNKWIEFDESQELIKPYPLLQWCPILYRGPFDEQLALNLAEQDSKVKNANHMAEGCVILSIPERDCAEIGRVQLKMVSNRYLEKG